MLRVVVVTVLLVSACAAPNGREFSLAGHLEAGETTAPPEGLAEYCERLPSECGAGSGAALRARSSPTGVAGFQLVNGRRGDSALFHALLMQRRAASGRALLSTAAAQSGSARISLDAEQLLELARVNRQINRAIRPMPDFALYGREEYWARPLAHGSGALGSGALGDCEDYALEKRAALIAAGWPVDALSLAVAVSPRAGLHAVLVVATDQGDLVLDNLYDRPQPIARLDYLWVSRQRGADLTSWTSVQLRGGVPGVASPNDSFQAMMR